MMANRASIPALDFCATNQDEFKKCKLRYPLLTPILNCMCNPGNYYDHDTDSMGRPALAFVNLYTMGGLFSTDRDDTQFVDIPWRINGAFTYSKTPYMIEPQYVIYINNLAQSEEQHERAPYAPVHILDELKEFADRMSILVCITNTEAYSRILPPPTLVIPEAYGTHKYPSGTRLSDMVKEFAKFNRVKGDIYRLFNTLNFVPSTDERQNTNFWYIPPAFQFHAFLPPVINREDIMEM